MKIRIETTAQVWQLTVALGLLAALVVACASMLLYDPERRAFELLVKLSFVCCIGTPVVYVMAVQLHKNHLMQVELQRLIDRDRLTDVATRDRFFDSMSADPDAWGVSLMIDIDLFKDVNDTHGHLAGDQVLRHIATTMKGILRDVDIVARFGGEEFVVFLHEADAQGGYRVAERMRDAIEAQAVTFEGEEIKVTVSIGGALKGAEEDINHALREADDALYRAKDEGRNRTVFAEGSPDGDGERMAA